jgi:iron(II)-dependent oxidoreductase
VSLATFITDAVGKWKHRPQSIDPYEGGSPDFPDVSDAPPDSRRLIRDRRYCRVLSHRTEMPFDQLSIDFAWKAIEHDMAIVPAGEVCMISDVVIASGNGFEVAADPDEVVAVDSIYLDRDCVTNADYARFVQADGYCNPDHWPEEVLPNVLQFVDRGGYPAPRFWSKGNPPADKLQHPVVGISWYEANAYATWVGKRLPTTEEWQRSGTWPKGHSGDGTELRYTWGNAFDPTNANTWARGIGTTTAVQAISTGNTPNGVRQLIGNVWEWVDAQFYPSAESGISVMLEQTMAEIRGGAFDTYFHSQATCQFRTGQPLLYRGSNIGFRCCVSAAHLPIPPDSHLSSETSQVEQ